MATPVGSSVPLTGEPFIDGLTHGSSWTFSGSRLLTYSLHSPLSTSIWTNTEISAVDQAFATWEAVANIDFDRIGGADATEFTDTGADIAVIFTGNLLSYYLEPGTLGLGVFPSSSFANTLLAIDGITRNQYPRPEGDIFLDDFSPAWWPYVHPGEIGFETILHEIGHALGLKHPHNSIGTHKNFNQLGISEFDSVYFTVMSYNEVSAAWDQGYAATPMVLDVLAIQSIYGANMSYHSGNDVYVLKNDGTLRCIWDAGGHDRFDASERTIPVFIDLYQNVNAGYVGLAVISEYSVTEIAFGVTIEDAFGGTDGDYISGNNVANLLKGNGGADEIYGLSGNDRVIGDAGNDILDGGAGNDRIIGGTGDDTLYGRAGSDVLIGGGGNDSYVLNKSTEISKSLTDNGIDTVSSTIGYTLGAQQENLILLGKSSNKGIGNSKDNEIRGNSGDNVLSGKGGNDSLIGAGGDDLLKGGNGIDVLTGGSGSDTFLFNKAPSVSNVDTITDLSPGVDLIKLDDAMFDALSVNPGSPPTVDEFEVSAIGEASTSVTRIIYDPNTGALYYDPDGTGVASPTQFALLEGLPVISADDFVVG